MALPLTQHPTWRQLLLISLALPLLIVLAVLSFAWPAARIAPRDLPVGIVDSGGSGQHVAAALQRAEPGAFDLTVYSDEAAARQAIEDRTVYGALAVSPTNVTVLTASAASPTVAQLLTQIGQNLASHAAALAPGSRAHPTVTEVDVVPTSPQDPRGLVISSALLPLTICSVIITAVIALLLGFRPALRQLGALIVVSVLAGLGVYAIAQGFLGALPHQHVATCASIVLTMLAMSAATAGLIALIGPVGLGVGAVLMVFVGNPFSGVTSAPELLPSAVGKIGQWLPPGAGANLLRSTAYFGGNGAATHLTVLLIWTVLGMVAVVLGHHTVLGHAFRQWRTGSGATAQ